MTMGRDYHREYAKNWYHARRAEYVVILGGKCAECGATDGLQFDHKDRKTKTFAIGKLFSKAQTVVVEELKKCQLLCAPCHIEKSRPEISASLVARHAKRRLDAKVAVV